MENENNNKNNFRKHKVLITRPERKETAEALVLLLNEGWSIAMANAGMGYVEYVLYKTDYQAIKTEVERASKNIDSIFSDMLKDIAEFTSAGKINADVSSSSESENQPTTTVENIVYVDNNNEDDKGDEKENG